MSYSVVIPTMGRNTLDRAVESALKQNPAPNEILVIAGKRPALSANHADQVRVVDNFTDTSKKATVARNRNIGIKEAAFEYISFLDDDDLWMPNKMKVQLDFLAKNQDSVSISSARYILNKFIKFKRPTRLISGNESILEAHYGRRRFFPSPYYTSTCGTVLSRALAIQTPFDEELPFCEDIWWFHELQSKGSKLFQHPEVLFEVAGNPFRAASRDTGRGKEMWASRLRGVNLAYESNYLKGIGFRNALLRGNVKEALSNFR